MPRTSTLVLIILIVIALVVGTIASFVVPPLLGKSSSSSCSGGTYNAKVALLGQDELGKQLYNLTFTKNSEQENGLYYAYTSNALTWIRNNTTSSAIFLNWWDYGKEIIGCTGRNSVISNPSAQLIALGSAKNVTERDSNRSLVDVATSLFTTNATLAKSIVSKYGANYVFITTEDGGEKAPYILQLLGLKSADYVTPSGTVFNSKDWTSLGQQTVIYRLLTGQDIAGLSQVYSDTYVQIYEVG